MSVSAAAWAEGLIARINLPSFRDNLIGWGSQYGRKYPWRETRDPYRILMAELLLHRTRANQVVPLYEQLTSEFPTPVRLAQASRSDLHRILYSAGLRWRVDLIRELANDIVEVHGGRIPRTYDELLSLPGVGQYIASALLCFAHGEPTPLLDTNTVRIIGRVFGIPITDASRRSLRFRLLMSMLVDPARPRAFNYALLDLGALVCTPRLVIPRECPIAGYCAFTLSQLL
jgi:A/G-specific adenine glycosylase